MQKDITSHQGMITDQTIKEIFESWGLSEDEFIFYRRVYGFDYELRREYCYWRRESSYDICEILTNNILRKMKYMEDSEEYYFTEILEGPVQFYIVRYAR